MTQDGSGPDPFGDAPFGPNPFGAPPAGPPTPLSAPHRPEDTNTPATLSIVFAFLFAPAGAVLGHLGLARSNKPGGRGRDRALIGLTLSYTIIVIAVVALVVWAVTNRPDTTSAVMATPTSTDAPRATTMAEPVPSSAPPPAPPAVDAAAMSGLLLSLDEVRALMGDPNMASDTTYHDIVPLTPEQGTFEPLDCIGAFAAGVPQPYEGSNYRKYLATTQIDRHAGPQVGQSVALFDDAAAAQKALAHYLDGWRRCANTRGTSTTPKAGPQTVNLGAPVDAGDGITTLRITYDGVPAVFYRTLAAKNNVLIDNQFGATSLTDQPVVVTKRILERIPG